MSEKVLIRHSFVENVLRKKTLSEEDKSQIEEYLKQNSSCCMNLWKVVKKFCLYTEKEFLNKLCEYKNICNIADFIKKNNFNSHYIADIINKHSLEDEKDFFFYFDSVCVDKVDGYDAVVFLQKFYLKMSFQGIEIYINNAEKNKKGFIESNSKTLKDLLSNLYEKHEGSPHIILYDIAKKIGLENKFEK